MGKRTLSHHLLRDSKSQTLPPSPSHSFSSSSSSEFEFTTSLSPRKSSSHSLCPADDLFYKGQLLPLHLSPRLSMVRTLLLASSSTSSSSDAATTASRHSTGSSTESGDSSRRASSVNDDDEFRRLNAASSSGPIPIHFAGQIKPKGNKHGSHNKYFSLPSFFKKPQTRSDGDAAPPPPPSSSSSSSVKRVSAAAKEVVRKYFKKVKPLYDKISQKQQTTQKLGRLMAGPPVAGEAMNTTSFFSTKAERSAGGRGFSHSLSGHLRYPRRKSCVSSCPSSIRSSPSHSGVLCRPGFGAGKGGMWNGNANTTSFSSSSSMDELQSAIQGAIAHCKNSLLADQNNKSVVSSEV